MTDDFSVRVDGLGDLEKRLVREYPKRLARNAELAMRRSLTEFRGRFLGAQAGDPGKQALAERFYWDIRGRGNLRTLGGSFYTMSRAAHSAEVGATITPKSGGYLALPYPDGPKGRSSSGEVQKEFRSAGERIRRKGRSRFRFVPGKDSPQFQGGAVVVLEEFGTPGKGQWYPVFLLVRKVVIAPRLGFFRLWGRIGPGIVARAFQRAVDATLGGKRMRGGGTNWRRGQRRMR